MATKVPSKAVSKNGGKAEPAKSKSAANPASKATPKTAAKSAPPTATKAAPKGEAKSPKVAAKTDPVKTDIDLETEPKAAPKISPKAAMKAASKLLKDGEKAPAGDKPEGAETPDSPLLDLSDAAVKKLIKTAKKRGYVTYEEVNAVLPSEEVSPDQIEDIMAMFSDMGINVVDEDEVEEDEPENAEEESTELAERTGTAVASKSNAREGSDRTDDPVRMYLREMGSVELLSREGVIAIAMLIEAGR